MSNIKRTAIALVVIAAIAIIASSFQGSDVLDRAIIVGIGVDAADDGLLLTCEVVSPGNGSEQVGTYSKIVTSSGATVGQALQGIAEKAGKEASLGQCVVVILGEGYFDQVDFSATTDYFINSNSVKESAVICCCEGSAYELMNKGDALSQSVSMSVASMLIDQAREVGVTPNNLLKYARSQAELHKTGFLNKVKFQPSQNNDAQDPDKTLGFFTYGEIAVFRSNAYLCTLNEQEVKGMSLFFKEVTGDAFVSDETGTMLTVSVNNKDVKQSIDGNEVTIEISLSVRLSRTDSAEVSGSLAAKKNKEIDPKVLQSVQQQATALAEQFLAKQAQYNFDLIKLHESLRQKQGTSDALASKPTADFNIKLTLKVEEN